MTVVSDGKAALSASTMDLMAAAGVRVDVLPLETASGPDAQISELIGPAEVYEGQAVPLSVTIDASADMAATLVLYQNGEATDTREVTLKAGENRYAFSLVAQKTGVVTYEARLVSREDAQSRNNGLAAYARVLGAPNVLLVEESNTAEKLFSASGMRVERIRPAAMPSGADGYLAYDAVVLNNIDFAAATQQQSQALDEADARPGAPAAGAGRRCQLRSGRLSGYSPRRASAREHRRAQQAAHAGPVAGYLH